MEVMATRAKRPRDVNQLAKLIVEMSTGEVENDHSAIPSARRAGGLKGGPARAESLTPEQRHDIAKTAAQARWRKTP